MNSVSLPSLLFFYFSPSCSRTSCNICYRKTRSDIYYWRAGSHKYNINAQSGTYGWWGKRTEDDDDHQHRSVHHPGPCCSQCLCFPILLQTPSLSPVASRKERGQWQRCGYCGILCGRWGCQSWSGGQWVVLPDAWWSNKIYHKMWRGLGDQERKVRQENKPSFSVHRLCSIIIIYNIVRIIGLLCSIIIIYNILRIIGVWIIGWNMTTQLSKQLSPFLGTYIN